MRTIHSFGQFQGNVRNVRRLEEGVGLWKVRLGAAEAGHADARLGTASVPEQLITRPVRQRAATTQVEEKTTNKFLEGISQRRAWRKPSLSGELDLPKENLSEKDYQQRMDELHLELQQISDQARQLSDSVNHPFRESPPQTDSLESVKLDKADSELLRSELRMLAESTSAQGSELGVRSSEFIEMEQTVSVDTAPNGPLVTTNNEQRTINQGQFVLHKTFGFSSAKQEESQSSMLDAGYSPLKGKMQAPQGQSAEDSSRRSPGPELERKPRVWEPAWLETVKESLPGANLPLRDGASERREQLYQDNLYDEDSLLETELAEQRESTESALQQLSRLSDAEISARAKQILGSHTSLESFSQERFNHHFKAGQDYLRRGKYRQAVDAFTLASMYKKASPVAYAGKSQALFAVGEYASSALFLARTLEIYPAYAQFKVDLVGIMGGKEKLDYRIAEAQDCLKLSDSPELQFLLAYVYLQLDRLDEARKAIDEAYSVTYGTSPLGASSQDIPLAEAIQLLKKAIDKP